MVLAIRNYYEIKYPNSGYKTVTFINPSSKSTGMVKVRRWSAYRAMERPYTRVSKFRTKNYTRGNPQTGITQFVMGNIKKTYSSRIELIAENNVQIRSQALEAARQACNRRLDKICGK